MSRFVGMKPENEEEITVKQKKEKPAGKEKDKDKRKAGDEKNGLELGENKEDGVHASVNE